MYKSIIDHIYHINPDIKSQERCCHPWLQDVPLNRNHGPGWNLLQYRPLDPLVSETWRGWFHPDPTSRMALRDKQSSDKNGESWLASELWVIAISLWSRLAQEHFIVLIPMPSAASGTIKTGRKQEPARSFTSIASNWTRPQETVADGFLAIINLHNILLPLDINQRQSDSLPQRFNLDMFHWIWFCSRTCNWPLASEHGCGCRLGKFWPFIATRRC